MARAGTRDHEWALELRGVTRNFGDLCAVDAVDLTVTPGEFVTLLGPSGSGKTTTLQLIAGFLEPDTGEVHVAGQPMAGYPPEKRQLGIVFQSYALFPHMNVADNVGFPLKVRRMPKAERERRISAILELVELGGLGGRTPAQLSGGQRQRVALARALVFQPSLLLMDEPLGALDRKLRDSMQTAIRSITKEIGQTVIYVTHDQDEAFAMSDRIAIYEAGRIVQLDSPSALYQRPRTRFVASFVGESNILSGRLAGGNTLELVTDRGLRIPVNTADAESHDLRRGNSVEGLIRPECVSVKKLGDGESDTGNAEGASGAHSTRVAQVAAGYVTGMTYLGASWRVNVTTNDGTQLVAKLSSGGEEAERLAGGDKVIVKWSPSDFVLLEGQAMRKEPDSTFDVSENPQSQTTPATVERLWERTMEINGETQQVASPAYDSPQSRLIEMGFTEPVIVRGRGAHVITADGDDYLDLEGGPGVVSVGHNHPRVVAAITEQAGRFLQGPGRYFSDQLLAAATALTSTTPGRLTKVMFSNSGAEAVEGGVKLALRHAIRKGKEGLGIIALQHGFHGRLSLPLSLTGMARRKRGFGPFATFPGVLHAPAPYCYRCPLSLSYPSCGVKCADAVTDLLDTAVPGEAAMLIGEPVLGVGGIIVPPDEYWPKVQAVCNSRGITLMHDEVFTGFGRTGRMFAHEHWSTSPDVISFGKAIGGGTPLAGVLATEEYGSVFDKGDHFTTFGPNNQIGLRVAQEVLEILRAERLADRATEMGDRFMSGLRTLAKQDERIGEVRGLGLMIGVEVVHDQASRAPAPDLASALQRALQRRGILVSVTGVHGCVIRITPPLVISGEEVDLALEAFSDSLSEIPYAGS